VKDVRSRALEVQQQEAALESTGNKRSSVELVDLRNVDYFKISVGLTVVFER
jgi:hypothetical protein